MVLIRWLLFPFSLLYWLATSVRNGLYNKGVFKSTSFDLPTIVIGNLSTGGTGKTPLTIHILSLLKSFQKTATLSRGYGRRTKGYLEVDLKQSYKQFGDEPMIIKGYHNDCTISVCEDRVNGVIELIGNHPDTETIILDDAFQHRPINGGLNILLSDFNHPFFNDFILPTGRLREDKRGAKRADILIFTKCPTQIDQKTKSEFVNRSNQYISNTCKVFFSQIKYPDKLLTPAMDAVEWPQNALLVTGLANSKSIENELQNRNIQFKHLAYPDHYPYRKNDLAKISNIFSTLANSNTMILTTRKDFIKLQQIEGFSELPWAIIDIEIEIDDKETFNKLIKNYVTENSRNSELS